MASILIVDDDELIAELASNALINAGHACGWVTSGEEAWTFLSSGRRPNLLLLDQNMPGISGLSLLRQIRGSEKFYDLPVMMFTALSGADDEAQAIFAGAQDFLRKPFDQRALIAKVEYMLVKRDARPRHKPLKTWLAECSGMRPEESPGRRRMV